MAAASYLIQNSAQAGSAQPVAQPTGAGAIRTMMQLRTATGILGRLKAWGCSFDATSGTPGKVELFETTVAATMSTAYAAADIMPHANYSSPANTAGSSGAPFNLSTTTSGFATAAVTEGTPAGCRTFDLALLPPSVPYGWQWPLGNEPDLTAQMYLRARVNFPVTVNMFIWMVVEF